MYTSNKAEWGNFGELKKDDKLIRTFETTEDAQWVANRINSEIAALEKQVVKLEAEKERMNQAILNRESDYKQVYNELLSLRETVQGEPTTADSIKHESATLSNLARYQRKTHLGIEHDDMTEKEEYHFFDVMEFVEENPQACYQSLLDLFEASQDDN